MLYYINSLYLYSLLGFILESTIYKIKNSKRHSSIFYGPITMVYGFGIVFLLLVKKYFLDKLRIKGIKKVIITFLISMITLTFIEWLGGSILYQLFHINLWDYSKKSIHFGKYVCLDLAFVWGVLGTFYLYYFKNITDRIIAIIPPKTTALFLMINLIDTIFVFINKFVYWK